MDRGQALSCHIERAHLRHGLRESHPVILALYDARADLAYWLLAGRYCEELAGFDLARSGERLTVSIPRSNVLDPQAMKSLAGWKNEKEAALRRT